MRSMISLEIFLEGHDLWVPERAVATATTQGHGRPPATSQGHGHLGWDVGSTSCNMGNCGAPHSHGCPFLSHPGSPTSPGAHAPQGRVQQPGWHHCLSCCLFPGTLGTEMTRATGTTRFIDLNSARRSGTEAAPGRTFAEIPRCLCGPGMLWLSPSESWR